MRILLDLQAMQTESRYRGIGRYARSLIQSLSSISYAHELVFVLTDLFPETVTPLRDFLNELGLNNIVVFNGVSGVRAMDRETRVNREIQEKIYSTFVSDLHPDVVLVLSPFEGYVDDALSLSQLNGIPICALIHDLIPLIQREDYLDSNPRYKEFYLQTLERVKKYDLFLANSNNTRKEILGYICQQEGSVYNIDGAAEPYFKFDDLRDEIEGFVSGKYILYTGGADPRKNLSRLISAYSQLPDALRKEYSLVLAGSLSPGELHVLKEYCARGGITPERVVFTGYVTDRALRQLYSHCSLFVFPSYHEGLGLPVLEAMKCGAPVIVANATALPGLVDYPDALFDPYNISEMRDMIAKALEDARFRQGLIENSKRRGAVYTWERSAKLALDALESAIDRVEIDFSKYSDKRDIRYRNLVEFISETVANYPELEENILPRWAQQIAVNQKTARTSVRLQWPLGDTISWRLEGPFDSTYSLAVVNREIARALDGDGGIVSLHSTEGPGDFEPNSEFLHAHADLRRFHDLSKNNQITNFDVQSRNIYPPRVADMCGKINMLHNYAWEESGFPDEWVEDFNDYLDTISCVSNHVKRILINNGVALPIFVCGNGVDHWDAIKPDGNFSVDGKKFKFLHVSSCFPRKGVDVLLEAFGESFSSSDEVSLIIKTFANPHNDVQEQLEKLRDKYPFYPDVIVLEEDLPDARLKALYESCDALVAPSFAEGFGLPMAEAMLSGLPVITTAWGGQKEFCTAETAWLIDYSFQSAQSHLNLPGSVWAVPTVDSVSRAMKQVYTSSHAERLVRVQKGKQHLLDEFRWQHVASRLDEAVRAIGSSIPKVEPRIGWVTTWDTKCGIATYSEHLLRMWPEQVFIYARDDGQRNRDYNHAVSFTWRDDNIDTLTDTQEAIDRDGIQLLIIQFNYGFFNFEKLSRFIERNHKDGRKIIVVLHSTIDPAHDPEKKIEKLVPAFQLCDRLLVHSCNDLNRLKSHGLVDNVALFPHGVLDYQPKQTSMPFNQEAPFRVATYGFFLPQKGLLETIKAFGLLKEREFSAQLHMFNAEFPAPISAALISEARRMIHGDLSDMVTLTTDFLPDNESLDQLSQVDLIIYPYQSTAESASGAVRYGLAANKPVAVSPSPIFDDVEDAVFRLPGSDPSSIADGIIEISQAIRAKNGDFLAKTASANSWREKHRYSSLSKRLHNITCSIWINH
ncbi:mannosyltransferase [Brucella anthropi]|uniref:glycosyltransferase n=1 Tax=Brucella anthropi TaxID=529 RepID=UPI000445F106|nr:glycosyltransferase [Brucella anthropi]EXL07027.1 mannosyltransferase [Brucella anthropi]